MIYTRFGNEIEIVSGNILKGTVTYERCADGKRFENVWVGELKADGGIHEIDKAIEEANEYFRSIF